MFERSVQPLKHISKVVGVADRSLPIVTAPQLAAEDHAPPRSATAPLNTSRRTSVQPTMVGEPSLGDLGTGAIFPW
jgi:hypothetical protein